MAQKIRVCPWTEALLESPRIIEAERVVPRHERLLSPDEPRQHPADPIQTAELKSGPGDPCVDRCHPAGPRHAADWHQQAPPGRTASRAPAGTSVTVTGLLVSVMIKAVGRLASSVMPPNSGLAGACSEARVHSLDAAWRESITTRGCL